MNKVNIILDVDKKNFSGGVFVTGFPGFGRVGYMVPKYISLALEMKKVGYIMTRRMPPVILVEEDGVGLPFELYSNGGTSVLVNRAIPEVAEQNSYASKISSFVKDAGFKYAVLIGGLSRDFMSDKEEYSYRWLSNRSYKGPMLKAPRMEKGLGVVGPLALLYIYLERLNVPTVMILPYSIVEGVDYDASFVGVKVVLKDLLEMEARIPELEQLAIKQKEEMDKIVRMLQSERPKTGPSNIYM